MFGSERSKLSNITDRVVVIVTIRPIKKGSMDANVTMNRKNAMKSDHGRALGRSQTVRR